MLYPLYSNQSSSIVTLSGSDVKELCVKMSLNGMGFRAIERVTGISHNTILNWVRVAETHIDEENYEIPEIAQIDELQTFVGSKKTIWVWTVVNTKLPGILKFVIGDRSLLTFTTLWQMIQGWACFLYIAQDRILRTYNGEDEMTKKTKNASPL
ncbi:IS1 family transposase [Limnospira fusiformis SAG 85.79]|uniref:IS1 family transposase n=1 Tax=Limnospira maxima CS-328 TaxID=513049 RepID=B5VWL6_LIMMA|nr:hypothetical protein AmaxDRAFT_0908 [Limnospira maxima CS-328]QJB25470.1 IS1 family transposase [Limnospira fusiformis SAG 85.79]UWU47265.1 IS1 transposase [Arthrospira platensis C1]